MGPSTAGKMLGRRSTKWPAQAAATAACSAGCKGRGRPSTGAGVALGPRTPRGAAPAGTRRRTPAYGLSPSQTVTMTSPPTNHTARSLASRLLRFREAGFPGVPPSERLARPGREAGELQWRFAPVSAPEDPLRSELRPDAGLGPQGREGERVHPRTQPCPWDSWQRPPGRGPSGPARSPGHSRPRAAHEVGVSGGECGSLPPLPGERSGLEASRGFRAQRGLPGVPAQCACLTFRGPVSQGPAPPPRLCAPA